MDFYREAKCIELHNSNVIIMTEDARDTYLIGHRSELEDHPVCSVKLCDIGMLADMLNIEAAKSIFVPKLSNQPCGEPGKINNVDMVEFPIYKAPPLFAEGKVVKLSCRVQSDKVVDIITTTILGKDDTQQIKEATTYCGSFTIWWASEEMGI